MKSKTARLRAVKEQILIRYLGCGWEEAHHPWSSGNGTYTSSYLFKFLKEVVIPLEKKHAVPNEPPLELPLPPEMNKLGTTSGLALKFKSADDGELEEFKQEARKERDKREAEGKGDRWMEMQQSVMPDIKDLKGFKVEMLFESFDAKLEWYHGVVKEVLNKKTMAVRIKWSNDCLHKEDRKTIKMTKDQLVVSKWNSSIAVKGGWCEYFTS